MASPALSNPHNAGPLQVDTGIDRKQETVPSQASTDTHDLVPPEPYQVKNQGEVDNMKDENVKTVPSPAPLATPGPVLSESQSGKTQAVVDVTRDEKHGTGPSTAKEHEAGPSSAREDAKAPMEEPTEEEEEGEEEEDEEGECGFCLFMKGGACREQFIAWEKCVEEGEKKQEDIVEKCYKVTSLLKECMDRNSDYYEPILRAERAMDEQIAAEIKQQNFEDKEETAQNEASKTEEQVGADIKQ